jgi:hypothetical protein
VTTQELLEIVRQKIGQAVAEIGGENPQYLDSFLLRYVITANFVLKSMGVTTGVTSITPDSESITPSTLDDDVGLLLAVYTAASLVGDDLVNRLRAGELGLSFSTGISTITTNQAAITLKGSSNELKHEYRELLTQYFADDPNSTIERLQ